MRSKQIIKTGDNKQKDQFQTEKEEEKSVTFLENNILEFVSSLLNKQTQKEKKNHLW